MQDELMTPAEVAAYLKVDEETLRGWRAKSFGPRSLKLGDSPQSPVRYQRTAVDEYIAARADQNS
jgi:hypothetical protein